MKFHFFINGLKKVFFTFSFILFAAYNSFALDVIDSDLSNSAGSNSGKDHAGMYFFICLFLVLAAIVPYLENKRS